MHVLKRKIARDLAALEEEFERALERALGSGLGVSSRGDHFRPATDVYQTADAVVIHVEVAGVRSEDIQLVADGEYLQVTGRRGVLYEQPPTRYLQMEMPSGEFDRVIRFPFRYDPDEIRATLSAGILTIAVPAPRSESRRIAVRSDE